RTLFHGGITLENVGTQLPRMRPHGDWIAVNGNRPAFNGVQTGFTGFARRGLAGGPAYPDAARPVPDRPGGATVTDLAQDYLDLDRLLSAEELALRERVRGCG